MATPLTPELKRELEDAPGGAAQIAELRRANANFDYDDFPKPTQADIEGELERLRADFMLFHQQIRDDRTHRFLKDKMPEKWAAQLEIGPDQHIQSRLAHNMIMNVVAMASRNPPKYKVGVASEKNDAKDRAQKQTRWLNHLWPAIERKHAIRRELLDNQGADGLGILEIYRTGAYDRLDTDERDGERPRQYMRRTEEQFVGATSPYGVRRVDPLCAFWDEDGNPDDPCYEMIFEEDVAASAVFGELRKRKGQDWYRDFQAKRTQGKVGMSPYQSRERPGQTIQCVRYYDRRWYAYIVDGQMVDGPVEHHMGFVPVVFYEGMTTGSPERSNRYQGAFWGMAGLVRAFDWLLTLDIDTAFALSKPKIAITTPLGPNAGQRDIGNPQPPKPVTFTGGNVPRLAPGEMPVNLTETFRGYDTSAVRGALERLIQISGLNPIMQGESPGSDPAGYAINALQSAAQSKYEVLLDNAARGDADLGNKLRTLIRDDLGMPWYLSAPMADRSGGGTVWLGLGPDDIDETPCEATIDPLSDVNKIAIQQNMRQANKEGYVARWRVQAEYGIDDFDLEDDTIIQDSLESDVAVIAKEEVKAIIMAESAQQQMAQAQASGLVDQFGNPVASTQGPPQANGASPAATNAPNVGGPASGASSAPFETEGGPDRQPGNAGGFDRGRRPPGTGA